MQDVQTTRKGPGVRQQRKAPRLPPRYLQLQLQLHAMYIYGILLVNSQTTHIIYLGNPAKIKLTMTSCA